MTLQTIQCDPATHVSVPRDRLEKLMEYADKEYVPNVLFAQFRAILAAPQAEPRNYRKRECDAKDRSNNWR